MTIITHPNPCDTLTAVISEWRRMGCIVSTHTTRPLVQGFSAEWLMEWCEA